MVNKLARTVAVLGVGLGASSIVGWLLLRENKRIREARRTVVKSQFLSSPPEPLQEIVLPREALDEVSSDPQPAAHSTNDDFTKIKGIGARYAEALIAAGITHYAQLAGQTPEALAALLLAHAPNISARQIASKDWIGQAARLARP